jgi:hypothetical protein
MPTRTSCVFGAGQRNGFGCRQLDHSAPIPVAVAMDTALSLPWCAPLECPAAGERSTRLCFHRRSHSSRVSTPLATAAASSLAAERCGFQAAHSARFAQAWASTLRMYPRLAASKSCTHIVVTHQERMLAPCVTKKWLKRRHGPRTEGKSEQTRQNEDREHRGCCIIIQAYLGLNLVATQTTSCSFTCAHWGQHMPCVIDAMALSIPVHQGARNQSPFQNFAN